MESTKAVIIARLNGIAAVEGKTDPEAAHVLSIKALLCFLDENEMGDVADAYRNANSCYWGDGYPKIQK